ncbi:hypothetical protein [Rickettsia endosymbiont of Orchestes rusci]|uniref:hypothetical protein n=1 Tax=Rickettsia endosymbiont of Orchestes rusci TaxID=3066250 RepID=UPI00313AFFB8
MDHNYRIMVITSMVSYRGLTGVVIWMVKNALGVIPAKAGIQKIIVILNLFQDLFQEMLKQVQHDKKSWIPACAGMTPFLWQFLIHATTPA